MMGERLHCGPENIREFNLALRQRLPGCHALAKALFEAGMMPGLAGASLESAPFTDEKPRTSHSDQATAPTLSENGPSPVCAACVDFLPDTVGDGTGIGGCRIGGWPNRLKWPGQDACPSYHPAASLP